MDTTSEIRRELDRLFREWGARAALAGAGAFLALSPLDFFSAPELALRFLLYRAAAAAGLLACAWLLRRMSDPRLMRTLVLLAVAVSSAVLEVMILATGGHHSPYLIGMILIAVVVLGVIPAGPRFAALLAATIAVGYLGPILAWDRITETWHFAVSGVLFLCVLAAALAIRWFHTSHIASEIALRQDLTRSRERLEREVAQRSSSEERLALFAAAIEAAGEGVFLVGLDGRIRHVNPSGVRMSGRRLEELVGLPVGELHLEPDVPAREIFPELHRSGSWTGEVMLRGPDREPGCFWLTASLVRDEEGSPTAMIGLLTDRTPQRRLEQERARAQRLDSIGVLAGGLAHDFNNLLTIILGNIDLARLFAGPDPEASEALDHAAEAALRAGDLTRQLITFSKGGQPVKSTGDIGRLVRETVLFAASGSSLAVEFDIPEGLPAVEFDEGQIRQVVHNLVQNADEAMPGGGTLRAAVRGVALEADEVPPLPAGRYVRIDVSDAGAGIPPDHVAQIFDPYFSTKEMSTLKGRGLGLAVGYSIVRGHGGAITVDSSVGRGTTVSILLPEAAPESGKGAAAAEEPAAATEAARPHEVPSTMSPEGPARGRVLVMDDEALVLGLAGAALRQIGYESELCRDGNEAVVRYQVALDSGKRFDTVILDLTVSGGMGGLETMARLRRIDPSVRAVLSSGYSSGPEAADYRAAGFAAFIGKPYTLGALRDLLEQIA